VKIIADNILQYNYNVRTICYIIIIIYYLIIIIIKYKMIYCKRNHNIL
jgi:hypothetical protein